MPKKRGNSSPPPASDESFSESEDGKKPNKKPRTKKEKEDKENKKEATSKNLDDDDYDDDEDLLNIEIPPGPLDTSEMENRDRLMISHIVVTNFKSYYGRKIIGPFHKSFTSIIGPNGSGKSNVIDALLFVFGFRSTKIRSKKLSSLIHKSSEHECSSCTVEIAFQRIKDVDDEVFGVVKNSRFIVGRTAFKDSSSKYTMDGNVSSSKAIIAKLRSAGVDLVHNRFLILQGEVEMISMMKRKGQNPGEEGMLEYLEDIIGSNRYVVPIKKLERRVEKLHAVYSQDKSRKELARQDKVCLEPTVRNTVTFLTRENEATLIRNKLHQYERMRITDKFAPLEKELDEKAAELKSAQEKQTVISEELKIIEASDKEMEKQKAQDLDWIDEKKKLVEEVETAETRRKNNLKRCNQDISRLNGELEKENKKKTQLEAVPEESARKLEALKEESENLREKEQFSLRKADEKLAEFEKSAESEQAKKAGIEKVFGERNTRLNECKAKVKIEDAELADLKKEANKDMNRLNELTGSLNDTERRRDAESKEFDELDEKLAQDREELKTVAAEAERVKNEEMTLNHEVRQLNERLINDAAALQKIGNNKNHKSLMEAKASGRLPGFIGRLGDLASIDEKYDVAISTNCGMLDSFVVQTASDGADAINFLTEKKLRRANFIVLSEMKPAPPSNRGDFPSERLYDLLTVPNPIHRPAFYFALGNLLVTNTLVDAQKIDRQFNGRYGITSLKGEFIDRSGAITGGGKPVSGRIGAAVPIAVNDGQEIRIDQLRKDVEEKSQRLNELSVKLRGYVTRNTELRGSTARMTERRKQLERSIEALKSKSDVLKKTISTVEQEAKKVRVDQELLDKKQTLLDKYIQERDDAAKVTDEAKEKLDEINAKIDAIFNELVQVHNNDAKAAHSKYVQVEKEIAKETAAINSSARNIAKVEERIAQIDKDLAKKRNELEKLEKPEKTGDEMSQIKDDLKQLEANIASYEERFVQLRKKQQKCTEEEVAIDKLILKLKEDFNEKRQEIESYTAKLQEVGAKINALKLNNVPKLSFITDCRPEDLVMELDEGDFESEEVKIMSLGQTELEQNIKSLVNQYVDSAYSQEYEMRARLADEPEKIDEVGKSDKTPLPVHTEEELRAIKKEAREELVFQLKSKEQQLSLSVNTINTNIIEEYQQKARRYNDEVRRAKASYDIYKAHSSKAVLLKRSRYEEFMSGYNYINATVRELYQMITLGGDATFECNSDPIVEGVGFLVRPPKKSWKNIENLSGGEKTLASLSLVFALHHYRPTPFYVMDEIDAALDFRNVSIIGHYIKERTKNAQFIIISLRNNMFELANRLVGICKVDDCTDNVAIDPLKVCAEAKQIYERIFTQRIAAMPDEVSNEYNRFKKQQQEQLVADEKTYPGFPSSKDFDKAQALISIESRLKKETKKAQDPTKSVADSRPTSAMPSRPESQLARMRLQQVRLVAPTPAELEKKRELESRQATPALVEQEPGQNEEQPRKGRKRKSAGTDTPLKDTNGCDEDSDDEN